MKLYIVRTRRNAYYVTDDAVYPALGSIGNRLPCFTLWGARRRLRRVLRERQWEAKELRTDVLVEVDVNGDQWTKS